MEWSKQKYNEYYNSYMPWIEDKYLAWFGENKTSYTTKENMKSVNITGNEGIGKVTDGLAEGVGGQLDSNGLLGGVGDATSKEGFNRAERGDTGPIDKAKLEKEQKGWGETLSGGFLGGKK